MKRITKILALVLSAVLCLSVFAGCGNEQSGETESENGVLKVGLECAYAPFNWTQVDDSNNAVKIDGTSQYANGYDVQIARKIAEGMGKELVVVKCTWEGLLPGVQSGAFDMIIAGMSPTAERKKEVDFSDAYYTSNLVVVVRKDGNYTNAKTINDFDGAKIVGQQGTFHETVIKQMPGVTQVDSMKDFPQMITALNSKTIDGYIAEEPGAIADTTANDSLTYIPLKNNDTGFTANDEDTTIAIGMKKGSDMLEKVNELLKNISESDREEIMKSAIANQPAE